MSFGRRERDDRRREPRREVLSQAAIYYGESQQRTTGLVRNISRTGANFFVDFPLDLPRDVVLQFCNGDEFDCEVVRDVGGTEFGLHFKDTNEFEKSQTKDCVDSVRSFTKSQSPRELYQLMEKVGFFGDEEIESIMKGFIASYDQVVKIYSDRILPQQS